MAARFFKQMLTVKSFKAVHVKKSEQEIKIDTVKKELLHIARSVTVS